MGVCFLAALLFHKVPGDLLGLDLFSFENPHQRFRGDAAYIVLSVGQRGDPAGGKLEK